MSEPNLIELVERLGGLLRAHSRRQGAVLGLQPVHLQVLDYLARCNRFSNTPAALTAYLQATKGTVSQSLKLLRQRGLVARRADADDRRVVRLALTVQGCRVQAQMAPVDALRVMLAGLPSADVAVTGRVLEGCLRALQRASGFNGFSQRLLQYS